MLSRYIKSKFSLALFFCFIVNIAVGETEFYTTTTTQVGPGVVHKKIVAPTVPWILNVLEIDVTNDFLSIESVKARDKLVGMETTSSMAARKNYSGHLVVGAINGDFYDMGSGIPIGTQVINGEMLKNPCEGPIVGFDINNYPFISPVSFNGQVLLEGDSPLSINGVNVSRGTDYLVLYNSFFGSSTQTNEWGTEIILRPINDWIVNDTIVCLVDSIEVGQGDISIPKGKAVLSGHGINSEPLQRNFNKDDTVKLYLSLDPGLPKCLQAIGGNLKIVSDGQYTGSTNTDVHPRTAVGFSADSTKIFFATVDGRQSGSRGMNYRELAEFMISLGAEHAINLDGGGSTTMVVRNIVENSLFAPERAVANALMVISSAPEGALNVVQIKPDNIRVFLEEVVQFSATGWDQYYNPVDLDLNSVEYIADSLIGIIDPTGKFQTTGKPSDSGYVYTKYGNLIDSAFVYVKSLKYVEISPKNVVTDNKRQYRFNVAAIDEDNISHNLPPNRYTWQSLDPEVGTIDTSGVFVGKSEGETKVIVSLLGIADTANVRVEIGEGVEVLDILDSVDNWDIREENCDSVSLSIVDKPSTYGTGSVKLHYEYIRSATSRSWVYIDKNIPIYGIPDSIQIDVKGDGKIHLINLIVSDDSDELFQVSSLVTDTSFKKVSLATSDLAQVNPNSDFNYPIEFVELQIKLGYTGGVGEANIGDIYFDNLRVKYSPVNIDEENIDYLPSAIKLSQNYPNPFNASTTIKYELKNTANVVFAIYDLHGRQVLILERGAKPAGAYNITWDGTNRYGEKVASGIYFYQFCADDYSAVKKMVLLR